MSEIRFQKAITSNELQSRKLDGRDYLVAPTTIIVAGVLNGGLVEASELEQFVERWDGRPIPLRHPQSETGEYLSASGLSTVESQVIGTFYNARFASDRIVGEMWFDVDKIERLGGDALAALKRMQNGEVLEVSTAYFAEVLESRSGTHNGKRYTEVQRHLIPDHVALLPDQIGACSINDGCGANRTNAQDFSDSVMVAFYPSPEAQKKLGKLWPDKKTVQPLEELHVTLCYLGKLDEMEVSYDSLAGLLAEFAENQTVILAETAGWVRFSGEDSDAVGLLVESEGLTLFRQWLTSVITYSLEQSVSRPNQYIPHITLAYVEKDSEAKLAPLERMPLAFDKLSLSWGEQVVSFDLIGEYRDATQVINVQKFREENMFITNSAETSCDKKGKGAATQNSGNAEGAETGAAQAAVVVAPTKPLELPTEIVQFQEMITGFGGIAAVGELLAGLKANANRERNEAIAKIRTNAAYQSFSDEELKAMPMITLSKMADAALVAKSGGQATFNARPAPLQANAGAGESRFREYGQTEAA